MPKIHTPSQNSTKYKTLYSQLLRNIAPHGPIPIRRVPQPLPGLCRPEVNPRIRLLGAPIPPAHGADLVPNLVLVLHHQWTYKITRLRKNYKKNKTLGAHLPSPPRRSPSRLPWNRRRACAGSRGARTGICIPRGGTRSQRVFGGSMRIFFKGIFIKSGLWVVFFGIFFMGGRFINYARLKNEVPCEKRSIFTLHNLWTAP